MSNELVPMQDYSGSLAPAPTVDPKNVPSLVAEQQRAKSEIEAALTIAAARPRDEMRAIQRIVNACQRTGLAERAHYSYSKGGSAIDGVTIDLMEVVAQNWGNLEFGFRELARIPGVNGNPGESIVEAFAWDLETNTRRRTQFTVQHAERTKKGMRIISDPRDIYEWVANNAQRRVRTALENIIPRDVVEAASSECNKTLHTKCAVTEQSIAAMLREFEKFGVTKDHIQTRIQRSIDAITPAQFISLRKIYASLRDGMSEIKDWFQEQQQQRQPTVTMDDLTKPQPQPQPAPRQQPQPTPASDSTSPDETILLDEYREQLSQLEQTLKIDELVAHAGSNPNLSPVARDTVKAWADKRKTEILGKRGQRSSRSKGELFDGAPSATEAGH